MALVMEPGEEFKVRIRGKVSVIPFGGGGATVAHGAIENYSKIGAAVKYLFWKNLSRIIHEALASTWRKHVSLAGLFKDMWFRQFTQTVK
jgi:sensor domain CHASE-containing protein